MKVKIKNKVTPKMIEEMKETPLEFGDNAL